MDKDLVRVWEEQVVIPTYAVGKPDKNPMFFEKRVYQGSSGVVYPNPVIETIADEKKDAVYTGLFLENRYLKIMILPQLGGRVQMAYDKIKQRHFVYYNQVIKPALVGLTGPWISGGIEFNWPQHHRPGTFSPVDYTIAENEDGSKTIWVNELEQMFHTRGMAGFSLYPGKAYLEIKVRLLNTTALPQTFLWWANPAVKVNDAYQSVFPPDVNAVFDHGKRAVSGFPIATGTYYKVDYAPGTDISLYKNIPVPTSYMAIRSDYDFVGGYEHDSRGGMLHVADHHISPGKKQWTWGHGDFGQAWDRNLTDEDGPYIELMAGVFTDNQPDFSWLMPNEEKSFTQYFLPYQQLGLVKNASRDMLLSLDKNGDELQIGVYVSSAHPAVTVNLCCAGRTIFTENTSIDAAGFYKKRIMVGETVAEEQLLLTVTNPAGEVLLKYEPAAHGRKDLPAPAVSALYPHEIDNNEQLFLTGQHLEQYRHATYSPVPYYERALERDAGDIRSNNALGCWYLRRGQFARSIPFFKTAIQTATQRNPNPYDCEAFYNMGMALKYMGRTDQAFEAFYKAAWDQRWKDSSYFCLAQTDMIRGHWELALEHIEISIRHNAGNIKAPVLKAAALRKTGQLQKAMDTCRQALETDAFNLGALFEWMLAAELAEQREQAGQTLHQLIKLSRGNGPHLMAYALDYAGAGLYTEATRLLSNALNHAPVSPLVYYYLAWFNQQGGNDAEQYKHLLKKAAQADSYCCFPNRLEEINILSWAAAIQPADAKAPYYLGNLFYDKQQYTDAITNWQLSVQRDPSFPTALRNLGIAYFNKRNDKENALACFEKAFSLDPSDARVLMELDQLYKRLGKLPVERMRFLEANMDRVLMRDDEYLEYISLLNFSGQHAEALERMMKRKFHPWEGGEGLVSGQYRHSLVELAKKQIGQKEYNNAISLLERAQKYPHNLGEGKLYGTQENDVFFWLGCAQQGNGNTKQAHEYFEKATAGKLEPSAAIFYNDQQPDQLFYQGLAWRKLQKPENADDLFTRLVNYGLEHMDDAPAIDYFAVSLPNLLVFDDDLSHRHRIHCNFMMGLGFLGLEKYVEAKGFFLAVLQLDPAHLKAKTCLENLGQEDDSRALQAGGTIR